jgi:hypothetical protein
VTDGSIETLPIIRPLPDSFLTVWLPNSIQVLPSQTFQNNLHVHYITFESPSRLTRIETSAFSNSSLFNVLIPSTVELLGSSSFSNCESLSSVSFESPSRLTQIDSDVFSGSSIESFSIPSSIRILGSSSFSECKSLKSVSFSSPSRLKRIQNSAFEDSSLESIFIPNSVVILGSICFNGCSSLSVVSFESNSQLSRIKGGAFTFLGEITSIVIPKSVEIIGCASFKSCGGISSVSFESNSRLKHMKSEAFSNISIKSIEIPRSVEIIGSYCFASCSKLLRITFEPNSRLIRVENNAFGWLNSLELLEIPFDAQFFNFNAVKRTPLSSIKFIKNTLISTKEFLIDTAHHRLIKGLSESWKIEIPNDIEIIDSGCFDNAGSLTTITFQSNSRLIRIESNAFLFSGVHSIKIPNSVEIIGSGCFSNCEELRKITFESNSRLIRIESCGFWRSSLSLIEIPCSVEIIGVSCFGECQSLSEVTFESPSRLKQIGSKAFRRTPLKSISIPNSVEILDSGCFAYCESLSSVSFESNSRLKRIEFDGFERAGFQSIEIPRNVQFIHGRAFAGVKLSSISIEPENDTFISRNGLLIDAVDHKLIRAFVKSSELEIPSDIEIISSGCFTSDIHVSSISFESNSRLIEIESKAFSYSSVESVIFPNTVDILRVKCFAKCADISSISFESPPHLKRLENQAFGKSSSQVVIHSTISFIASDAVLDPFQISLDDEHYCPEFDRWREVRKSGVSVDFRRISRVGSGLSCLKDYIFEEGATIGSDQFLVVVKSMPISEWIGKREIENEIENLINLHHPCINSPIGFVLPSESEVLRELKIARLYTEGYSLAEVLSTNPVWWTTTVKAQTVLGIVLGLRFAHSFGLLHGHLTTSNIRFDVDHRVQITDFGFNRLNKDETDVGGKILGFSGERWTPEVDVYAFMLILFEIVTGSSPAEVDLMNYEYDIPTSVKGFVSEMIMIGLSSRREKRRSFRDIFDALRKHNFRIWRSVDTEDVSAFVRWVEMLEESGT